MGLTTNLKINGGYLRWGASSPGIESKLSPGLTVFGFVDSKKPLIKLQVTKNQS